MPRWFPSIGSLGRRNARGGPGGRDGRHGRDGRARREPGSDRSRSGSTLELLVVEGPEAGSQFTIDGETIAVGRGATQNGRTGQIGVRDPTVSPRQAVIYVGTEGVQIEHRVGATNPTLVNGEAISRATLRAGDRIQMGHTAFEVRSRPGIALSGLLTIPEALLDDPSTGLEFRHRTSTQVVEPGETRSLEAITTEIRAALPPQAELVVLRGIEDLEGHRFPLLSHRVRVGRHHTNDVVLTEKGVSRFHAELVWEEERLFLVHKSGTNPSYVDGRRVQDRAPLRHGQNIQLADRVVLRIDIVEAEDEDTSVPASSAEPEPSLRDVMEEKLRRDAEIERDYGFFGSFLDIDVVDSHGLKVKAQRPEHIIVSFERFRAFTQRVVEEHQGQVLNSNGDELMCFFDGAEPAVRAAIAVIERLAEFNARQNLLGEAFRVRQGIHTGSSLLDRVRGVAYSPVLDVAGHLQKYAPVDGLLVSAETLSHLSEDLSFTEAGEMGKEKVRAYRLEWPGAGAAAEAGRGDAGDVTAPNEGSDGNGPDDASA